MRAYNFQKMRVPTSSSATSIVSQSSEKASLPVNNKIQAFVPEVLSSSSAAGSSDASSRLNSRETFKEAVTQIAGVDSQTAENTAKNFDEIFGKLGKVKESIPPQEIQKANEPTVNDEPSVKIYIYPYVWHANFYAKITPLHFHRTDINERNEKIKELFKKYPNCSMEFNSPYYEVTFSK